MEPVIDLQDWELLAESDPISNLDPKSLGVQQQPIDHDSEDDAIKSDYFSLNPIKPVRQPLPQSEDEIDSGSVDSDNPSWVDPDSDSRNHQARGQIDLSLNNSRSFWSDESSVRSEASEEEEKREKGESLESLGSGEKEGDKERNWWKMPLEILKVWVLRARPVWSISIAAAIVGVMMLGRRLYKMKQRGKSIPLRISLDDKVRILVDF